MGGPSVNVFLPCSCFSQESVFLSIVANTFWPLLSFLAFFTLESFGKSLHLNRVKFLYKRKDIEAFQKSTTLGDDKIVTQIEDSKIQFFGFKKMLRVKTLTRLH